MATAAVQRVQGGGSYAAVGQLVQHGHVVIGVIKYVMDEVGTDEPGTAGNKKSLHKDMISRRH